MPRSRTSRKNEHASKESGRKREHLFAPERDEWQRLSPNRARPNETNSGQPKPRTGSKARRSETGQELPGKSSKQRSRGRRYRSTSNQRAKNVKPEPDQPMISARTRKPASKSSLKPNSLQCSVTYIDAVLQVASFII